MTVTSIALMPVEQLIGAISGKGISPGAGSAGAVTLALAAACAGKAAAISLKHQPGHAQLTRLLDALEKIGRFALSGADRDAEAFSEFIRHHSAGSLEKLIREGDRIARLIDILADVVDRLEPLIDSSMGGDLLAARALAAAARTIQVSNSAAAQDEQAAQLA